MDTSSLPPGRLTLSGEPPEQRVSAMRNELRQTLSRLYKLENHDIFFVQSVRVALVILTQLFHQQEVARCAARQASQQQVSELLLPSATRIGAPGNVPLIAHVNPYSGQVNSLYNSAGKGVVDGCHSFATMLHEELVRDSAIFVAPLHMHAALTSGLALIALRTAEFSTLLRSELLLFEASTVLAKPLEDALINIRSDHWQPYNVAQAGSVKLADLCGMDFFSTSDPRLPFSCFNLPGLTEAEQSRIKSADVSYFSHMRTLRISCRQRGEGKIALDSSEQVKARLRQLWPAR
ncbi:DUF6024 family protein [Pantoea sp. B65]|uniref:DUF6024 family protein n=1 Tax=Pantoea sp. B65 TaxID=2813359 RepID=UPI0039B47A46